MDKITNCTLELTLYAIQCEWPKVVLSENSSFYDAVEWSKENCDNRFSYWGKTFYFENSDEATIFALRWV